MLQKMSKLAELLELQKHMKSLAEMQSKSPPPIYSGCTPAETIRSLPTAAL